MVLRSWCFMLPWLVQPVCWQSLGPSRCSALCSFDNKMSEKKNSEFSLLCLSLCEFEFQKILHILPDSDNHK